MAIPMMNDDVKIIQKLSDHPNQEDGLSAEQIKEKFDTAAVLIKSYLNGTVVPAIQQLQRALNNGDVVGIDASLSKLGYAADAAATGSALAKKLPIGLYTRDTFWVDSTADPKTPTFWDQVIGIFDSMPVGTVEHVHAIVVYGYGSVDSNEPSGGGYRVTITKYGSEDYGVVEAVNYNSSANSFNGPLTFTRIKKNGVWLNTQYPFANIYNSVNQVLNTMLGVVENE